MRQRKAKDLEKRLEACGAYLVGPDEEKEKKYFPSERERDLFLEIGCGKGQFIIQKAVENPGADFIGIEGQETVMLRALERAAKTAESDGAGELGNIKFILAYIDNLEDLFDEGQLSGIYLNFSDPWPKARHAKRRLTHRRYLAEYGRALKPGGFIEIKTDDDDLFEFTLEEIEAVGYTATESTRDLHGSGYPSRLNTTEYEDKFVSEGKNINYVRVAATCNCDKNRA